MLRRSKNLVLIGILCALALATGMWWIYAGPNPAYLEAEQSKNETIGTFASEEDNALGEQETPLANQIEATKAHPRADAEREKVHERLSDPGSDHPRGEFEHIDPASSDSIVDFLDRVADESGWTANDLSSNIMIWEQSCALAKKSSELSPSEFITTEGIERARRFSEYCSDISKKSELAVLDSLERRSDRLLENRPPESVLENLDEYSRKQGLGLIFRELGVALDRLNEAKVQSLVATLIMKSFYQTERQIGTMENFLLHKLIPQISTDLICQRLGGCTGKDHPVVLRFCLLMEDEGVFCDNPSSIVEAIYQTTTPVEYRAFLSFRDWVFSELRKRR